MYKKQNKKKSIKEINDRKEITKIKKWGFKNKIE